MSDCVAKGSPHPASGGGEGIEIGAVSLKWVCIDDDGVASATVVRHEGDPRSVVKEQLALRAPEQSRLPVITGESARALLDLPYRSEPECIEKALTALGVVPDLVLSLGGETFSLYTLKGGVIKNITSTTKCAAGTGEFLVQQFRRMDLSLEEGIAASRGGKEVKLATRCSVHCKTDATHKLNKGECLPADIANSLLGDLARKIQRMVDLAQWPAGKIVVAGGVSRNAVFVSKLRELLPDSELVVLEQSPYLEAYGAALFASESGVAVPRWEGDWFRPKQVAFDRVASLDQGRALLDFRVRDRSSAAVEPGGAYLLGVDAGSTTTKAVLFHAERGTVDASCYLRTHGNPITATKNCLRELQQQVGDAEVRILQAGATGSGREMVSVYLENCASLNEILTHARAAAEEVPEVDTVFEIGGQDSKFISFLNGIPVDYAMNEGCSAGTGSFLEESAASDMQVPVLEIASRAERSGNPLAFGERCAAFINTDLRNALQQGAEPDDVIAGLVYSIADNYISRIVGSRTVGEHLLFQGGVALNRAVALAMAVRTGKHIVVPPYPELMGAVGTALMLRDQLQRGDLDAVELSLDQLLQGEIEQRGSFRCASCDNRCEIQQVEVRQQRFPFGGLCSKFENQRHARPEGEEGRDLVALRNRLMFEHFGPRPVDSPRGRVGLPLAVTAWELLPFYAKLINELGYEVVLSEPCKEGNDRTTAAVCFPCQIAHGAVFDLERKGVDFILLPHALELAVDDSFLHAYTCTATTVIPDLVRYRFPHLAPRLLTPHVGLRPDQLDTTVQEVGELAGRLGVPRAVAEAACRRALVHYQSFRRELQQMARSEVERLLQEPTVILAGRPYSTCAPEVNLALPRKIVSRGYHVVPADLLPPLAGAGQSRNAWAFTQQMMNAVAYASHYPEMYACLLSCFSCGPDASTFHLARRQLAGQTFCYLEIDSHTAHAGVETRVGAFLDIIEERRSMTEIQTRNAV